MRTTVAFVHWTHTKKTWGDKAKVNCYNVAAGFMLHKLENYDLYTVRAVRIIQSLF